MPIASYWTAGTIVCALLVVATIPQFLFTSSTSRGVYVGIIIPVLSIAYGIIHYALITKHIAELADNIAKCQIQSDITTQHFDSNQNFLLAQSQAAPMNTSSPAAGGAAASTSSPSSTRRRSAMQSPAIALKTSKNYQLQLIQEMDVDAYHRDMFRLQAKLKDLSHDHYVLQSRFMDFQAVHQFCSTSAEKRGATTANSISGSIAIDLTSTNRSFMDSRALPSFDEPLFRQQKRQEDATAVATATTTTGAERAVASSNAQPLALSVSTPQQQPMIALRT